MGEPLSTPDVRGRDVRTPAIVLALAVLGGALAALCDVAPTGSRGTDAMLTFVVAAFVAWAGASAPRWSITAAGLIAAVGTAFGPWMLPALVGVGLGVAISFASTPLPWVRVIAVGLVVLSLLNLRVHVFLGASAILAGVVMLSMTIIGVVCRTGPVRGRAIWVMVGAAVLVVLAASSTAFGAFQAQDKLQLGNRLLTDGFDQLRRGETELAAETLAKAAEHLQGAAQLLDSGWTAPAKLLPVVAQHRALATEIVGTAALSARAAADALAASDVDRLRLESGNLDVATLGSLAEPFANLDAAVRRLADAFDVGDSPWLIGAARRELAKARPDIDAALVQTEAIAAIAARGPAMFGTEGPRRYLVVFTSPGVAQGQGGVIDGYAEISIADGSIEQTATGRNDDLIAALAAAGVADRWSTATTTPDTPTAAAMLSEMYAAAGHGEVDGVIIIDPIGLAAMLDVAGPVDVLFGDPPVNEHVDAARLRQFLLLDQYQLPEADRQAVTEAAAAATLQQFLGAMLPGPQRLGEALGPPATEGHIAWWARRADEQAVIQLIGMSARLPSPDGRDGLAIVSNNAAGNIVDAFAQRTVAYTATFDPATAEVTGDLVITLQNNAPVTGYDEYVIGNDLGLPSGTNRTSLSIYTPLAVGAVTVDGVAVTPETSTDLGWNVATLQIDVAPGQTRTVRASVSGQLAGEGGYRFVWRAQPLTTPDVVDIAVTGGDTDIRFAGQLVRNSVIDGDGIRAER